MPKNYLELTVLLSVDAMSGIPSSEWFGPAAMAGDETIAADEAVVWDDPMEEELPSRSGPKSRVGIMWSDEPTNL